ncbi:calcium channel flower isoform X1 [Phymastichus coffea]|uniref:calcium channel flower isoform X1 n=1 Tax=Phymastichus coffea TaxID=108790 RepID=UPI00273C5D32|nr:calcium channel flower isoform X1 [Phymastichus coffea]
MSFQDKLTAIMQKPGQDPNAKDDAPWYLKYGGRIVGTFGGFISILVGAIGCLGIILFSVWSFLSGICMMLIGFLVIVVEAPCCCMFIEFVQKISNIADSRPYWNRAALYCGLPIIPLVMNLTITTFFACALIFCTGLIYGVMAIGKKASRDEMSRAAATVDGPGMSSHTKSNLVENAQPIGLSNRPDSNV